MLAILAIVGAVLIPSVRWSPDSLALETSGQELAAAMRSARAQAIAMNSETLVKINVEKRTARMPNGRELRMPTSASLKVVAARSERFSGDTAGFRFFPDGTSTGGEIFLSLQKRQARIAVNWISGATTYNIETIEGR
ncbi:hypothetical protein HFO02_35405 [Rhizobium laguerreae]|nr:hypothetical protein [Rhizobium laguerreae]